MKELEIPSNTVEVAKPVIKAPGESIPVEVPQVVSEPIILDESEQERYKEILQQLEQEDAQRIEEKKDAVTQAEKILEQAALPQEAEEKGTELEEGFVSKEAQEAYHEYVAALHGINAQTGEGLDRAEKAMDDVKKYTEHMSISRLLTLTSITLQVLVRVWMGLSRETGEEKEEEQEQNDKIIKIHEQETVLFVRRVQQISVN